MLVFCGFIAGLFCTVQAWLRLDFRLLVGPMVALFFFPLVRQMFCPALFCRAGVLALLSVVSLFLLQLSSSLGFLCLVEESDEFLSGWCS